MGDSTKTNEINGDTTDRLSHNDDPEHSLSQSQIHPDPDLPREVLSPEALLHQQQKSILRNSANRINDQPSGSSRTELADHCRGSRKGVRFSDESSPGRQNTPEDERRKVPCYEPSPQAVAKKDLNIPEESWSEMLRTSFDINSLKQLLDQTSLNTDSTDTLQDQP